MKTIVFVSILTFGMHAAAMGDIERAVVFAANSASGGTLLPGLEAEKTRITLKHEREKAARKLEAEKKYQGNLRKTLELQIQEFKKGRASLQGLLDKAQAQLEAVSIIGELLKEAYLQKRSLSQVSLHLKQQAKTLEVLGLAWSDLMGDNEIPNDSSELTLESFHNLLLAVSDRQSEYGTFIESIKQELINIDAEIDSYTRRLQESP